MTNVTFGLGPASVSMPLAALKRVKDLFRRRDPSEHIHLLPRLCEIRVPAPDEGEVELYLWIVNLARRHVLPDHFTVNHWSYLSVGMPELPWTTRSLHAAIPGRSIALFYMRSQLNAAGIKRILEVTPREGYRLAGRRPVGISGEIHFERLGRGVQFEFEMPQPALHAYFLAPDLLAK